MTLGIFYIDWILTNEGNDIFSIFLLFKGGKLVGTKVGATSEKDMLEFIQPHI